MMGFTALLTYPSHVKALYRTGGMSQSQCMFRMCVMKKGSQQMMNTPGGEHGGQAGPAAGARLAGEGPHSVGALAQEHCKRSPGLRF